MSGCRRFRSTGLALALAWSLGSIGASAQTSADTQAADRAFNEARALMDSGRYAEACPRLESSQRLAPASGTLLNLGDCYEHLGRLGSAWKTFEEAAVRAKAGGKRERERVARERSAALVPRLSRIVLVAPTDAPSDLLLVLDGSPLASVVWGAPIIVDAGPHSFMARASGRQTFSTTFRPVAEGETLSFQVPPLAVSPTATSPDGASASSVPSRIDGQRVGALVSAGVGVAGLVAGTAFGLHSMSRHDESDRNCEAGACNPRGVSAMEEARTAGDRATVAFILGGVGLTTASVLWFVRPFSSARPARAEVSVGPSSILVRGNF